MRIARIALALFLILAALPLAAEEGVWTPIGPEGKNVTALAVDPTRPFLIYAGVEGLGVYRSFDRGRTWAAAGLHGELFLDLAVDPMNPDHVVAVTRSGVARSTDRGASWDLNLYLNELQAVSFVPGQAGVLFAGIANGLWKSNDGGVTWSQLGTRPGRITALAVDPRAEGVLYAGLASGALFRSTDGGLAWRRLRNGQGRPVTALAVDPMKPSVVYAGVGGELLRSLDRGATWARAGRRLPGGPVTALAMSRSAVLAGTSAGLFRSTDRALGFQDLQPSFPPPAVDDLALDRQDPPRLYARVGGALHKTADRGGSWSFAGPPKSVIEPLFFSPSHSLAVATDGSETLYLARDRNLARSDDGGRTWTYLFDSCLYFTGLFLHPQDARRLLANGGNLSGGCGRLAYWIFGSGDAGSHWNPIFGWALQLSFLSSDGHVQSTGGDLYELPIDGLDEEPIYAGLSAIGFASSPLVSGRLWAGRIGEVGRSEDDGRTWSFSSAGLPPGMPVDELVPDLADPDTLYAATAVGAFKSTDAGATWTPVGAWPAGVVLQGGLAVDPADPSILYAGTDLGVLLFDQED